MTCLDQEAAFALDACHGYAPGGVRHDWYVCERSIDMAAGDVALYRERAECCTCKTVRELVAAIRDFSCLSEPLAEAVPFDVVADRADVILLGQTAWPEQAAQEYEMTVPVKVKRRGYSMARRRAKPEPKTDQQPQTRRLLQW